MKNIESVLRRYLEKETQYAIQLVGPWGRGKTHFYKNHLEKFVESIPTFKNNAFSYKPVYISLFGLKSVDEIQIKIFHELLYSRISKKTRTGKSTLKISSRLTKLILSGYLTFKGVKNSKEFIAEVTDVAKDIIDTGDLFICFDDLERKSTRLAIEDLIGYINMLTEENIKVLIISNENRINETTYADFKEKVIGITLEYNPQPALVISQIISTRYQGFKLYSDFLKQIESLLVELVEKNDHNYRLIIYGLDNLHDIYSTIRIDILEAKKKIAEKCEEFLPEISKYVLTSSIEYKKSYISYKDKESMEYMSSSLFSLLEDYRSNSGQQPEQKADKSEVFVTKYYDDKNNYKFYDSIFGFVTGANDFDIEEFQKEFKKNYHLEKGKMLPQYEIAESLYYYRVLDLSDADYEQKTLKLIEYAKQGQFKLTEYLMVYHYASRFENILNLDLDAIRDELLATLDGLSKDEEYLNNDDSALIQLENSQSKDPNQEMIRHKLIEIVRGKQKKRKQTELNSITQTFEKDLGNLYDRYHGDTEFKLSVTQTPVFASVKVYDLFQQILKAPPSSIIMLKSVLNERYGYSVSLESERDFLLSLIERLDNHLDDNPEKTLRNWTINELLQHLLDITGSYSGQYNILDEPE